MIPNPTPATPGNFGISAGASGCLVVCGGATFVATPQGNYIVPEVGFGVGGSVGVDAGPKVTAPEGPELQGSAAYKFGLGPADIGGSGKVTVPLENPSPGNISVEGNIGVANAPGPLKDLNIGGSYSYDKGPAGGVGYDAGPLFGLSEQTKGVVTYPIHLPDISQTLPPDANGVSDVITQTGAEGPPAMSATRTLPAGYPDGKGDTVTLNPDGSFTVHTSTADVTTFGPNYLEPAGNRLSPGRHAHPSADRHARPANGSVHVAGHRRHDQSLRRRPER